MLYARLIVCVLTEDAILRLGDFLLIQCLDLAGLGCRAPHSPQNLTLLGSFVPQLMQKDPDVFDVSPTAV